MNLSKANVPKQDNIKGSAWVLSSNPDSSIPSWVTLGKLLNLSGL